MKSIVLFIIFLGQITLDPGNDPAKNQSVGVKSEIQSEPLKVQLVSEEMFSLRRCAFAVDPDISLTATAAAEPADRARQLADKAREVIENSNFEMASSLRILDDKGRERVRKMWMATRNFNEVTKSVIRFREPAEVNGMALLVFDYPDKPDDMWMYLPALRKERRLVSDEKAKSFMGSEFSNNDLSVPQTGCFTYQLLGSENAEGHAFSKVEAVCINDLTAKEYGFSRKVMWIDETTYLTLKIEFYDFKGQLWKIQRFSNYKKLTNGKYFAWSMTKENVQNGRKSEIRVDQFTENSSLAEGAFTPAKMQL